MNIIKKTVLFAALAFFSATTVVVAQEDEGAQVPQQMSPDQAQTPDFSDDDLKKFASVYPTVVEKNQNAQNEMMEVIQENGMEVERYNEIQTAQMQEQDSDASKDELESVDKINEKFKVMQPEAQQDIEKSIEESGLSLETFQAVAMAIQSDQNLQQKLQKMIAEDAATE